MRQKSKSNLKNQDPQYAAGYDAGKNGANTTNSHFSHFAEKTMTQKWQAGYDAAKRPIHPPRAQ